MRNNSKITDHENDIPKVKAFIQRDHNKERKRKR
jgi:hypothetical protein